MVPSMRRVAVFARPPVPGRVKTRLSPALPPAAACALYRGMLADALAAAGGAKRADERIVYWAEALPEAAAAGTPGWIARRQRGADLGERLAAAFDELLAGADDRAVVIGADAPALDAGTVDRAFERLEAAPLVIAPARDGGYALIGLARPAPALFRGIEWSTERVLAETKLRAADLGLALAALDPLADVDSPADLCALVGRAVRPGPGVGPHTRAALEALGFLPQEL